MDFVCKGTKKCLHMQYLKEKNVFFDGPIVVLLRYAP